MLVKLELSLLSDLALNCEKIQFTHHLDFHLYITPLVNIKVLNHIVMVQKILFSAMESVINMMKEVELQERAAKQAKEEAAKGGLDTLIKVEELKQVLGHAKGANDMVG